MVNDASLRNVVKLVINDEQESLPSKSYWMKGVLWTFSIQSNESGKFLEIQCEPNKTYWECVLFAKIYVSCRGKEIYPRQITREFSNYTPIVSITALESDFNRLAVAFDSDNLQVYDFTESGLFNEPITNISDIKLKVDGQVLYGCKKILATYSKYFYKLGYGSNDSIKEHTVKHVSCNLFRVFLGLLYHQNNWLKVGNVEAVAKLSRRYDAEHCLEACEQFIINANLKPSKKLSMAQGFNFENLHFHILSKYHSLEDILKLGDYDSFALGTKRSIIVRVIELKYGKTPSPPILRQQKTSFTQMDKNITDVVLSVGDQKLYVSKQLLAYNSNYFNTLFYSDFIEKGKHEIELQEVDANEFEMFLQFVYHPNHIIKVENVEALLKLSQMYDVRSLFEKCANFLKMNTTMSHALKIRIAMHYHVQDLFGHVMSKMPRITNQAELLEMDGFDKLDMGTIMQIVEILKHRDEGMEVEVLSSDSDDIVILS